MVKRGVRVNADRGIGEVVRMKGNVGKRRVHCVSLAVGFCSSNEGSYSDAWQPISLV
jgi:hypothetical protein